MLRGLLHERSHTRLVKSSTCHHVRVHDSLNHSQLETGNKLRCSPARVNSESRRKQGIGSQLVPESLVFSSGTLGDSSQL